MAEASDSGHRSTAVGLRVDPCRSACRRCRMVAVARLREALMLVVWARRRAGARVRTIRWPRCRDVNVAARCRTRCSTLVCWPQRSFGLVDRQQVVSEDFGSFGVVQNRVPARVPTNTTIGVSTRPRGPRNGGSGAEDHTGVRMMYVPGFGACRRSAHSAQEIETGECRNVALLEGCRDYRGPHVIASGFQYFPGYAVEPSARGPRGTVHHAVRCPMVVAPRRSPAEYWNPTHPTNTLGRHPL